MAKQIIDIGTQPNDGTGDELRMAFDKINQNFDVAYPAEGSVTKTVGSGKDFETFHEAMTWAQQQATPGLAAITLSLDDGIHECGPMDTARYANYEVTNRLFVQSVSGNAANCIIALPSTEGDNWGWMFYVRSAAFGISGITIDPKAAGYAYDNWFPIEVSSGSYFEIYSSVIKNTYNAISSRGNGYTWAHNLTVDTAVNAFTIYDRSHIRTGGNLILRNCSDVAIYVSANGSVDISGSTNTFTGNAADTSIPVNEIQNTGEFITDGTQALTGTLKNNHVITVGSAMYPDLSTALARVSQSPSGGNGQNPSTTGWDAPSQRAARFQIHLPAGESFLFETKQKRDDSGNKLFVENILTRVDIIGDPSGTSILSPCPAWEDPAGYGTQMNISSCANFRFLGVQKFNFEVWSTVNSYVNISDPEWYLPNGPNKLEIMRLFANHGGSLIVTPPTPMEIGQVYATSMAKITVRASMAGARVLLNNEAWAANVDMQSTVIQAHAGGRIIVSSQGSGGVVEIDPLSAGPAIKAGYSAHQYRENISIIVDAETFTDNSGQQLCSITENQVRKDGTFVGLPNATPLTFEP